MEDGGATTRESTTQNNGNQQLDQTVLMNSKPLHRFVQKEPRSLGIALVIFGCAELLMGFNLAGGSVNSSYGIYIPFWQGLLFLVCGNLSIYTEIHPSKKMVTVCLAMYIVSLVGIVVSVGFRFYCLLHYSYLQHNLPYWDHEDLSLNTVEQVFAMEGILFTSSLAVSAVLIFLSVVARLALRSTRTQLIVQHIPLPQSDAPSN